MELLVCIVNRDDHLEAVLSGFLELGVSGATVVHSEGMGRVMRDLPVFAGLQSMLSSSRAQNAMILSVIQTPELMDRAVEFVRSTCGNMEEPSSGILFTVPVNRVMGLAPATKDSGTDSA